LSRLTDVFVKVISTIVKATLPADRNIATPCSSCQCSSSSASDKVKDARRDLRVKKSELLHAIQQEIRRHDFSHFVDQPPSRLRSARRGRVGLSRVPEGNQHYAAIPRSTNG
jgi:hypothetical protein